MKNRHSSNRDLAGLRTVKGDSMKRLKAMSGRFVYLLSPLVLPALMGCVGYVDHPRETYSPPPPAYVPPAPVYAPPPVVYVQPTPAYVPPPAVQVEVSAGSVGVEIRSESDFYEPLTPYGRWEVVGAYGRCWIPSRVDPEWRPYSHGNWQRTDAGWYWASDEPWAWATYHYGRWDLSPEFGWYWVPQTQWAPAWVSWHEGGGYVGWAALQPSVRLSVEGSVALNVALIAPRAFVFVEPRHFLEPVRPTTVVVNNTTIINNTVNITNVKVVNNTVINEGPRTQVIEQASGQKLQAVPVRQLRLKQEAPVVAQQRMAMPLREKKDATVQTPSAGGIAPRETKGPVPVQSGVQQNALTPQEQSQKTARELENKTQVESQRLAGEVAAKAHDESKARELERKAQLDAQQRAVDLQSQTRAESQRRASEATAKVQEQTQLQAAEAQRKELDQKVRAEAQKKPNAQPELSPRQEQIRSDQRGTNTLKKALKPNRKPSPPENAPAPSKQAAPPGQP